MQKIFHARVEKFSRKCGSFHARRKMIHYWNSHKTQFVPIVDHLINYWNKYFCGTTSCQFARMPSKKFDQKKTKYIIRFFVFFSVNFSVSLCCTFSYQMLKIKYKISIPFVKFLINCIKYTHFYTLSNKIFFFQPRFTQKNQCDICITNSKVHMLIQYQCYYL